MKISAEILLQQLQEAELGGFEAQKIYAPPYRSLLSEEEILANNPKYAAVNILLYPKNGEWYFPLILRTHNENDRHSGQISLPGGKKDDTDEDFSDTALRETSPIYIPPSNFFVYAYLSYVEKTPVFKFQETEVQEILEIPLSVVQNMPNPPEIMELPNSNGYQVPYLDFNQHKIWGATSMILSELNQLLKNV